ncbi:MAG: hypothetical protein JWM11_2066 [Planctomycetaceae bacterium]|nr:hypothetical protein [Planctomycetaceae bacterium]
MRRWCVGIFIATYLTALTGGILSQTLRYGMTAHPVMYFFVWDMYCGWSAYNVKFRAVAEGVSGTCYDLEPAPWGTFRPFNTLSRFQYSTSTGWMAKTGAHTVAHTEHEPIARIFIIEETWAKKFDLPDYVWNARYNTPKHKNVYTTVRVEMDGTGTVVKSYPHWVEVQKQTMVGDNPRLQNTIRSSVPFWIVDEHQSNGNRYFQGEESSTSTAVNAISAPATN